MLMEYLTVIATRQEPLSVDDIREQSARTIGKPVGKKRAVLDLKELAKRGVLTRHRDQNRPPTWYSLSALGRTVLAAEHSPHLLAARAIPIL